MMSKMNDLAYDIEQLYIDGLSARQIAAELGCPVEMVLGAIAEMGVDDMAESTQGEAVFASMVEHLA
jgi:hypothetical protein